MIIIEFGIGEREGERERVSACLCERKIKDQISVPNKATIPISVTVAAFQYLFG